MVDLKYIKTDTEVDIQLGDVISLLLSQDIEDVMLGVTLAVKYLPYHKILELRDRLSILPYWTKSSAYPNKVYQYKYNVYL